MLNKFLAGALTLGKVASAEEFPCHDTEPFDICLDRVRNGECGNQSGCDRTCEVGRCTSECYDRIPASHTILWNYSRVAYCPWPNTGGYGCSYPTFDPKDQSTGTSDWFPWNEFTVSQFCKDVFLEGKCEDTTLSLTYTWVESVPDEFTGEIKEVERVQQLDLHAPAKTYCRFSCGFCNVDDECWSNYSDKMQTLYKEYAVGSLVGDFGETFENSWDDSWGDDSFGEEESVWDSWWRKRRSASPLSVPKNELLAEAVESMIFPKLKDSLPLNVRVRRGGMWGFDPSSFFDQGNSEGDSWGSEEETPADAQTFIGNNQCFPFMANDASLEKNSEGDSSNECEEGQEFDEEEGVCVDASDAREDPGERVRSMRRDTDHDGIKAWLKDYSNGVAIDGEYCSDIINIFEEEYLQEMLLEYSCPLTCGEGSSPWYIYSDETKEKHLKLQMRMLGKDELSEEEKLENSLQDVLLDGANSLKMECRKPHYQKLHKPSDCRSTDYCGETSCQGGEIMCIEDPVEESEESYYYAEEEEEEPARPSFIYESEAAEEPNYEEGEYEEEY